MHVDDYGVGPVQIDTPGDLLNMINALDADYQRVDADITASVAPQDFKDQWSIVLAAWNKFVEDHQSWFSRLFASGVGDQIDSYRSTLIDWQKRFLAVGGQSAGPAVAAPNPPNLSSLTSWIPWVVGGVALIYLGPPLLRSVSGRKKS